MTETPPDDELLEFLGSVDEVIDETEDEDFADFLADTDIDTAARSKPAAPEPSQSEAEDE